MLRDRMLFHKFEQGEKLYQRSAIGMTVRCQGELLILTNFATKLTISYETIASKVFK